MSSIRRVVKAPERWPRIVELARDYGETLPPEPDAAALNAFLLRRKQADPAHYPDVSLAVLKLMGPGEYVLMRPGDEAAGALRTGGARLHALHRAQSAFRGPRHAAASEGARRRAAVPRRRVGRHRPQLHSEGGRRAQGGARHDQADRGGGAGARASARYSRRWSQA